MPCAVSTNRWGGAGYSLTHDLPRELAGKLPDAKQIEAEILRELGAEG